MKKPFFLLLISGTELIKYPGISAAGASHEMLRYTAKLDAEFIASSLNNICHCEEGEARRRNPDLHRTGSLRRPYGTPRDDRELLPVSPHGIVSPALIVKACLNLLAAEILILDLGSHEKPNCDYISIHSRPSADITQQDALSLEDSLALYSRGQKFISKEIFDYGFDPKIHEPIIAECLVGGTTTALGLLTALGHNCNELISSSFPAGNFSVKEQIIQEAINRASNEYENFCIKVKDEPLIASTALGDALQPFIAGMICAASTNNLPMTLGGGSQMLAIKTLSDHLFMKESKKIRNDLIKIITTPWIYFDLAANFQKLKEIVSNDTIIDIPDIEKVLHNKSLNQEVESLSEEFLSRKLTLQEIIDNYNQGHVKEGIGLGAILWQFIQ